MQNNSTSITSINEADAEFQSLLDAWRTHEELRSAGASVAELATSRAHLDSTRSFVRSTLALAS